VEQFRLVMLQHKGQGSKQGEDNRVRRPKGGDIVGQFLGLANESAVINE
jgi:hypothetical protein